MHAQLRLFYRSEPPECRGVSVAVAEMAPVRLRVRMPRLRVALTILCAWLGLSFMRMLANVASGAMDEYHFTWPQLAALALGVAFIWLPVTAFVLWLDRGPASRRLSSL